MSFCGHCNNSKVVVENGYIMPCPTCSRDQKEQPRIDKDIFGFLKDVMGGGK